MSDGDFRCEETARDYSERILRVLLHVQTHLDEAISLDDLARIACFSPFHFHRVFRGLVGEGVMEHVRRLRLERAAHRLKFGDESVLRLALEAGYETHESFTRAFAAHFGKPPSEFRKEHRSVAYPEAPSRVHYAPDGRVDAFSPAAPLPIAARVETIEPVRVVFVRHSGPYGEVGVAWQRLFGFAFSRGLVSGAGLRYFGLAYDDPDVTPESRIRYDACLVSSRDVEPEGDVGVQEVRGGAFAVARHRGPYSTLGATYAALCGAFVPSIGRRLADPPSIERYLNDPRSTPEADLETEIAVPVE